MRWLAIVALLAAPVAVRAQFGETVTVHRLIADVRVTTSFGTPVRDLRADDFTVTVGGQNAAVESLTWIDDVATDEGPAEPSVGASENARPAVSTSPSGRIFIFFIQTDFARNKPRLVGQMSFTPWADKFIDALSPNDRVAVFSFDSHLKFRRDLTNDKEQLKQAVREALRIDDPGPVGAVPSPSLASRLDAQAMNSLTSSETAMMFIANALHPIPGPKTLLLIGWGLGERLGNKVEMSPKWKAARRALEASRVTIFALDTTFADYHDLQHGLETAAVQTGGFYAKTYTFAQQAMLRLERTLSGHYELELRAPSTLRPGTHEMHIRVSRRGLTTLAPSSIIVRQ